MIKQLSTYRTELMGFAILIIVIDHLAFWNVITHPIANAMMLIGSCGVEIFLLLSGFGLYYAYSKTSSDTRFLLRRFNRILPVFLITYLMNNMVCWCKGEDGWQIQYYLYGMWYILGTSIFYLMFPVLYTYVYKERGAAINQETEQRVRTLFILSAILTIIGHKVLHDFGITDMYSTIMNIEQRLLIFIAGMTIITQWKPLVKIYQSHWIFAVSLLLAFFIHYLKGQWTTFIFGTYFFLAISGIKYIIWLLERIPSLGGCLRYVGNRSLEWYLVHMTLYPPMISFLQEKGYHAGIIAITCFVSTLVIAIILHYCMTYYYRIVKF